MVLYLNSIYYRIFNIFDNNNNDNNGVLTVYPPSGSSPVKNYNINKEIYDIKSNNIGL